MKCGECNKFTWFGDYALYYCDITKKIVTADRACHIKNEESETGVKKDMKQSLKNIAIKTIKTMAETALSFLTIGMALNEVDWLKILSVSAVAGIYTILFNLKEITIQGD